MQHSKTHNLGDGALRARRRSGRGGFTLLSLAVVVAAGLALLGGLVAANKTMQANDGMAQTRQTLSALHQGLKAYEVRHLRTPEGPTSAALAAMLQEPAIATVLKPAKVLSNPDGSVRVLDGYGREIVYRPANAELKVAADFVSAGPDGEMGDANANDPEKLRPAADNIHGADTEGQR